MRLLALLKKVPIDFGQESVAETTYGKRIAKSLVPPVEPGESKTAADVGCRTGVQSRWLESLGYEVTSVDIEKRYAKCRVADVNEGLPFDDEAFDLLWCSEVIEHLRDPRAAAQEFRRVLRPGGRMILTTPNSGFWLFRLFNLFGLPPQRLQREDHLHFFRVAEIERLFPAARLYGFFPYLLVKRTLKSHRAIGLLSPTLVILETKETAGANV